VRASAIDPGFPEADSAYQALRLGSDGRLYFTLCSHRIDTHARLGGLDPGTGRIELTMDVGAALGEDPGALPQGKIHVTPAEAGGRLYLATMLGYYEADRQGHRPYPGFRVAALDLRTRALAGLARGPEGEGLITGILDPARLHYYGLTYPSGLFCRYDVRAGVLSVSGRPAADPETRSRIHGRPLYPICRSLGLDADGAVYGSGQDGAIWCAEPGGEPRVVPGVNVGEGAVPPVDRVGRADGFWRVLIRCDEERCFYGIHAGTRSLFRFDPRARRIEPLARLAGAASRALGHAPFRSQLGLAMGPGRVLHHIAHGPPVALPGRPAPRTTAYLVSYDLDRGTVAEHGPILTDGGDRVLFAESLAAGPRGDLYTVGWVEVAEADPAWPRYRRLRAEAASGECRGEVYRMMLLRIPAARGEGDP
jgi:hypothetical protein